MAWVFHSLAFALPFPRQVDHVRDTDVKLCDFGVSRLGPEGGPVGDAAEGTLHELIGSVPYIAPEVFARSYGPQCDLWSLARRDCLRSTFLDYSRLDALLFTATAWIFIPAYCFVVP